MIRRRIRWLLLLLSGAAVAVATAQQYPGALYTWPAPAPPLRYSHTEAIGKEVQAIEAALGANLALVVPRAFFDAKGDVLTASANDTICRIGVGTNGQVLTADSIETCGLKWALPALTTDIDAVTGQTSWDTAATKKTAPLTVDGVDVDFEAGAAEGFPRLASSTLPPGTACDAAGEAGRLYFDTDADLDGSVFLCRGTAGWKDIDDDGGAGSTAYGSLFEPAAKPVSSPSQDDEFDDSSFNATLWTEWDHEAAGTVSENKVGLKLNTTGTANSIEWNGVRQAIPSGDFSIATKVQLLIPTDLTDMVGLALLEDGAVSTGDVYVWIVQRDSATSFILRSSLYSDHNTFSAHNLAVTVSTGYNARLMNVWYMRIRRTGTTYKFDFSPDGIAWVEEDSRTLSFTPVHMALVANRNSASGTSEVQWSFFRYVASDVGVRAALDGRRIGLFPPP